MTQYVKWQSTVLILYQDFPCFYSQKKGLIQKSNFVRVLFQEDRLRGLDRRAAITVVQKWGNGRSIDNMHSQIHKACRSSVVIILATSRIGVLKSGRPNATCPENARSYFVLQCIPVQHIFYPHTQACADVPRSKHQK